MHFNYWTRIVSLTFNYHRIGGIWVIISKGDTIIKVRKSHRCVWIMKQSSKEVVHHVFNFIQILTAVSTSLEPIWIHSLNKGIRSCPLLLSCALPVHFVTIEWAAPVRWWERPCPHCFIDRRAPGYISSWDCSATFEWRSSLKQLLWQKQWLLKPECVYSKWLVPCLVSAAMESQCLKQS